MSSIPKASHKFFQPYKLGPFTLKNRCVMAALARKRCDPATDVPNDLHVQYYSERGQSAGLMSTECTYVSEHGDCYPGGPGIINKDQIEGWKRVTKAVHEKNGLIFLQAFHCGRAGHPDNFGGKKAIAPSPIAIRGKVLIHGIKKQHEVPEEIKTADVPKVIQEFATAAKNTAQAGFDGIELHGANGYLIDEFLMDSTNQRKDEYGGSVENRCRMPLAVVDEFIKVFGAGRVGIKLSPVGRFHDMYDSDPLTHYKYLLEELTRRSIGYAIVMGAILELATFGDFWRLLALMEIHHLAQHTRSPKPLFH